MTRKKGWIAGLVGAVIWLIGNAMMTGIFDSNQEITRTYPNSSGGWVALFGLVLMIFGILANTHLRRDIPTTAQPRTE